jgi:hypothetical protein
VKKKPAAAVFVFVAVLCAVVGVACEPGRTVAVEDATTTTITLFFDAAADARPEFTLRPLETKRIVFTRGGWKDIVIAKDSSGTVIFDERITWDELQHMQRIVIQPHQPGGSRLPQAELARLDERASRWEVRCDRVR